MAVQRKLIDREKSRSPSLLFGCDRSRARGCLWIDWRQKRVQFSAKFIYLSHSAYISFRIYYIPHNYAIPQALPHAIPPFIKDIIKRKSCFEKRSCITAFRHKSPLLFFNTSPCTPVFRSSATQTPTFQPLKLVWINQKNTRVAEIYVVVEFHSWFKFYFLLFQTHYLQVNALGEWIIGIYHTPQQGNKIAHVRYTKILTWLGGFLVIFLYLVWFRLCSSLFWELRDNGVVKNLQFCP